MTIASKFFYAGQSVTVGPEHAKALIQEIRHGYPISDELVNSFGTNFLDVLSVQVRLTKILSKKDVRRGWYVSFGHRVDIDHTLIHVAPACMTAGTRSGYKNPTVSGKYVESCRQSNIGAVIKRMSDPQLVHTELGLGWGTVAGVVDLDACPMILHFQSTRTCGGKVFRAKVFWNQWGILQAFTGTQPDTREKCEKLCMSKVSDVYGRRSRDVRHVV